MASTPRFAMVAGEASGDLLASLVLQAMQARWPALQAAGIANQAFGRVFCSCAAAARKRGASASISEARLPGSRAMTSPCTGRPSVRRAATWSASIGMTLASGWPT